MAALLVCASNAWALDAEHATKTWNSLIEDLNAVSGDNHRGARSKYNVLLDAYVVSGSDGLVFASRQNIPGPVPKSVFGRLAYTLYDGGSFALYSYNGYHLHVWYTWEGDASLILMTSDLT